MWHYNYTWLLINCVIFRRVDENKNTKALFSARSNTSACCAVCHLIVWGSRSDTPGNISTYFEPSGDNRPFHPIVIYSRTTQRALSRLKVCTHWATNRLPATLLVGRCVSRSGSGTCHQWSDGCCVILRPCDLQVCLGSLSQPGQQAVFTSAKSVLPG